MCGSGEGVSDEELATFAATNMVNDWLSPEENVKACTEAGWQDVTFVDLTADIRISFQLMLKKVERIIDNGNPDKIDEKLLLSYKQNLANRIVQVDRYVYELLVDLCFDMCCLPFKYLTYSLYLSILY